MTNEAIVPEGKIVLKKYLQRTKSGLDVPEPQKGESRIGIVEAFGAPRDKDPKVTLTVGQRIVFKKYVSNSLYIPDYDGTFDFIEYDDICWVLPAEASSE